MKTSRPLIHRLAFTSAAFTFSLVAGVQAQTFTVLSDFSGRNSYPPDSAFVQRINGNLYNVSTNGGTGSKGNAYKATVPAGATTGKVSVVTPSGMLNSNPQFVVTK